jgi:hypothetical protein
MSAVSLARWQEAQAAERAWWSPTPARAAQIAAGHAWLRELLAILPVALDGVSVTDLGGGAVPIVGHPDLPLVRRIVVDPLVVPGWPAPTVPLERVVAAAEDYHGDVTDEVWGYNVLQHVRDPGAVLSTARTHAAERVRWFEYVGTPIHTIHPHTITARWLLDDFAAAGWTKIRCAYGIEDGHAWVAGIWERA